MIGLVLSGGGARAAYQAGALKALGELLPSRSPQELGPDISVIMGSSLGAINGVILSAGLKTSYQAAVDSLLQLWGDRTFENTFGGSISTTLLRSLKVGFLQYLKPGPRSTATAIFDPSPLRQSMDEVLFSFGGASVDTNSNSPVKTIGVMTTQESDVAALSGSKKQSSSREGLLLVNSESKLDAQTSDQGLSYSLHYVNHLSSSHAFASAALPFVMPPVQIDLEDKEVSLVDGGIIDNLPIDPAVRFGASKVIMIDTSGKRWWHDYYGEAYDTAEPWAVCPPHGSYCLRPAFVEAIRSKKSFGKILRDNMGRTTRDYIRTFGPVWPIYQVLNSRVGEEVAFEILSYAVIHQPYLNALIELGYQEARETLLASNEDFST